MQEYFIDIMGYIPYTKGGILLQTFHIDFFKTANGLCPTIQFLDSLEEKMRAKVLLKKPEKHLSPKLFVQKNTG